MNPFHDKLFFGASVLTGAAFSTLGAVLTEGESRWLFATLTASIMMSAFLALMFKKSEEAILAVVGRCGFAVFGGIFMTRPVVHFLRLEEEVYKDIISLAGMASLVCIGTFFVGYALLKLLEIKSPAIAKVIYKKIDR